MSLSFEMDGGRRVSLTAEGDRIVMQVFPFWRNPVVLKTDYLRELTGAIHQGTLWFAYINVQGKLICDRLGGGVEQTLDILREDPDAAQIQLLSGKGRVFLVLYRGDTVEALYEERGDGFQELEPGRLSVKLGEMEESWRRQISQKEEKMERLKEELGRSAKETEYAKKMYEELSDYTRRLQDAVKRWRDSMLEEWEE